VKAVNLIPHDQRRGAGGLAGRSGGIVYVVVGGLAVIVALGVDYAFTVKTVADREGQLAAVTAQVNTATAQAGLLAPYVEVAQLRQQAVASVISIAESRFDWPDAMRQLALALPPDVTLTSITGSAGAASGSTDVAPSTTTSTGVGGTFGLSGCASSQAEVATVLTQLAKVPGVSTVTLTNAVKAGTQAPNAGPQVARGQAEAVGGGCPLVSFQLSLSYGTTYGLPNQKLTSTSAGSAQTVSSTPASGAAAATTSQPAG